MKHSIIKIFFVLPLLFFLSACENHADHNKLVVGLSAEYPPFEYRESGEFMGFDIDLAHALGKKMNLEIEIKDMNFAALIPAIQYNNIDAAISAISATEERRQNLAFSEKYYTNSIALLYLKDAPLTTAQMLEGKKIGAQLGSTMEIWAKENAPAAQLVVMDVNPVLVESLKNKNIDAVVLEEKQAEEFYKQAPSEVAYTTIERTEEGYSIAVKKDSLLLPKINKALKELKEDGTLDKIQTKWIK
ncbi:polar amino acid transport system substrate-binding protein [Alphaproteobacteria bacterium]